MNPETLVNLTTKEVMAERLFRADGFRAVALGLLARPPLRPGEALLLRPGGSVHTCGMRYAIDVLFLDRGGRVLRAVAGLAPWRIARAPRGTSAVIELPAGSLGRTQTGDLLSWSDGVVE